MEAAVKAWVATQEGARYASESVMNYADWEAGQPLMKTSMAGFHLCPVWEEPTPAKGELVIRMEPGLAFGSGYHPTTRTCLELLRRVYDTDAPRKVLDLGTGTGILSLAASALGAERVVAVEYNELAVQHCGPEPEAQSAAGRGGPHSGRRPGLRPSARRPDPGQHPPGRAPGPACHPRIPHQRLVHFLWHPGAPVGGVSSRLQETPLKEVETLDENMWFAVLARGKDL